METLQVNRYISFECHDIFVYIYIQIYSYFQPLMVCMSPSYTYKFIDVVTTEYNMPVFEWSNALKEIFTEVRLMFY